MSSAIPSRADIVIVGGRPAGATLALRLAHAGLTVVIVDRARFPSLPAVPSCAMLYPHTLRLLDELELDEREFGDATSTCRRLLLDVDDSYRASVQTIDAYGRDYIYGIDRARFDAALWSRLEQCPNITACQETAFVDVLRNDYNEVQGIRVRSIDGVVRKVKASCVVGADGRFSPFAQRVGAKVITDFPLTSTAHFATWEGLLPPDDDPQPTIHIHTNAQGLEILFFPTPLGRVNICTHARSDAAQIGGSVHDYYLRTLARFPEVVRRTRHAKLIGPVLGLKRIANRFREPGGPGWFLVGDAYYHKDPIDGQGIYDALCGTKILAEELVAWHAGAKSREDALLAYGKRSWEASHPTFKATTLRIRRELYSTPPKWVVKTFMRWMLTDPRYGRGLLEYICRVTPPETWPPPSLVAGALARGCCRDVKRILSRDPAPWALQHREALREQAGILDPPPRDS